MSAAPLLMLPAAREALSHKEWMEQRLHEPTIDFDWTTKAELGGSKVHIAPMRKQRRRWAVIRVSTDIGVTYRNGIDCTTMIGFAGRQGFRVAYRLARMLARFVGPAQVRLPSRYPGNGEVIVHVESCDGHEVILTPEMGQA